MSKRKLWTRILIGAAAGGLTALTDKEVRGYVKERIGSARMYGSALFHNPVDTISTARSALKRFSDNVDHQAENLLNALGQVEETVSNIRGDRMEQKKLEAPEQL